VNLNYVPIVPLGKALVYGCAKCKRTITIAAVATTEPDLLCRCEYPTQINMMQLVGEL
jgi:hypothetical protein